MKLHRRLLCGVTLVLLYAMAGTGLISAPADEKPQKPKPPAVPQVAQIGGFSDWVASVAFSPEGKTLAVGSYGAVKLFDASDRKELANLKVNSGFVRALAYSPDGSLLAEGHYQGATLWETASKKQSVELKGHRGYVTGVAFSADGKLLATSSEDETARVWEIASGEEKLVLRGHAYPVQGVAFSPDGKLLATAAGDETRVTREGEVKLWDATDGKELHALVGHEKAALGVAFSPDGKFLVSTGMDEKVNVYEVPGGKALGFYAGHSRPVNAVLFAPGGETVISASGGRAVGKNEVKIWNRADGSEIAGFEAHEAKVTSLALSPDGKTLATGGYDKLAALWNVGGALSVAKTQAAVAVVDDAAGGKSAAANEGEKNNETKKFRAGIIGLDTSHATAFTKILNDDNAGEDVANCRIVAAYPKGSPDIESSTSRVPGYTEEVQKMGVEIVESIPALLEKVDVVFLETNDGRPHLDQVIPVLKAGKPVFIDKPVAGSLADAVAIYRLAEKYKVPVFSSSSLRYGTATQEVRNGSIGTVVACVTRSPCSLEATHPDLFWYGIHGVEALFTAMGTGCQQVTRTSTNDIDVVTGVWDGGRVGTFQGLRTGKGGYGGTAIGDKGIAEIGKYDGYRPLLVAAVRMFRTGEVPVPADETLEIYAFMEAADVSKREGGVPITLESVMKKARADAEKRLEELGEK